VQIQDPPALQGHFDPVHAGLAVVGGGGAAVGGGAGAAVTTGGGLVAAGAPALGAPALGAAAGTALGAAGAGVTVSGGAIGCPSASTWMMRSTVRITIVVRGGPVVAGATVDAGVAAVGVVVVGVLVLGLTVASGADSEGLLTVETVVSLVEAAHDGWFAASPATMPKVAETVSPVTSTRPPGAA
jgi:hypothetical protein